MTHHTTTQFKNNHPIRKPVLSVVIPMFNEEKNVNLLLDNVTGVMEAIEPNYEIIVINDGSSDGTSTAVAAYHNRSAKIKLICFSRNFGKEAALNAGLAHATGDAVIQLDADLQHPPEIIQKFYAKWKNGSEIVYGKRQSRDNEAYTRRFLTKSFYKIFSAISDVKLMEGLGDFLLMDRKVVDALLALPERERFTKGLYAWVGFCRAAVPFEVAPRQNGQSTWNIFKLFMFAMNAITSFGTIPLKIWTYIGLFLVIPSFTYGGYTIIKTVVFGIDVPGYASLMVAVCFFSGIQLLGLGIIGEYIGRVLTEVKQRPLYLINETLGFVEADMPSADNIKRLAS